MRQLPIVTEDVLFGWSRTLVAVRIAEQRPMLDTVDVVKNDVCHGIGKRVAAVILVSMTREDAIQM